MANKNSGSVDLANTAWNTIVAAANAHDIDPALLAAIAIRETGFQNLTNGVGVGIFQITVGKSTGVTAAQAQNLTWAANYAANMLETNMNYLATQFPNLTQSQLIQAAAASYDFGISNISGNPNTIDLGTTGNNYGANILLLMDCF